MKGIRFRGYSIPECQAKLPKAKDGKQPLPEALLWLLLTSEIPTEEQTQNLVHEISERSKKFPAHVSHILKNLPTTMHPMTQFTIGVNALQTESQFAKAYLEGVNKAKYWEYAYEDMLNLISFLPRTAAEIYRNVYHGGKLIPSDPKLDMGADYAHQLGFENKEFVDLMRLYLVLHSDHEGGNVSAHTTHLVGSALSDPYLSFSAGLNGLAGPLHGLANQEVLRFILKLREKFGGREVTDEELKKALWDLLNSGQVLTAACTFFLLHSRTRNHHHVLTRCCRCCCVGHPWLRSRCAQEDRSSLHRSGRVRLRVPAQRSPRQARQAALRRRAPRAH